jgi:hypothetical protein
MGFLMGSPKADRPWENESPMNAAIPERRPATEEISGLIERVTFHNDDSGKNQGADVVLESWEDMNHDFQIFGPDASQSADALRRFGEVIDARGRGREKKETISC